MKRILSLGVVGALGVLMGCPIYGDDSNTQPQDCTVVGCPAGELCTINNSVASCVPINHDGGTTDAGPHPYSGCFADTDCSTSGPGTKCLAGTDSSNNNIISCTTVSNLCADETQCTSGNCVQGVCTPSCATSACPTGFTCDSNKECTINTTPCTVPGGACGSNGICIEQHCVDKCGTGNSCATGLECVNGGCMPHQQPTFICSTEGVQAECATGSICLRHNCYISCAGNPNTCSTADQFNVCKAVTVAEGDASGSYQVCGSNTNLGSDCDPTIGKNCPNSGVCIDGYCH